MDTAAPCLHDVHLGKGGCNPTVADLREAGLHLLNRDFAVQHTGGGDLQPVVKERYLDFTRCQVAAMADGIRDHLADGLDRQLIVILTGDAFDAGAEVDVLQHEVVGTSPGQFSPLPHLLRSPFACGIIISRKKHEKGWTTVPMNQREREQFYLSQARELGQQLGDSPELAQLCRAAYEDYRQGLLSGTAYDKIQALCADLAHPH